MPLFERDGDRFLPTGLSRGPWDDNALNGGPVAALVAWGAEQHDGDAAARSDEQLLARLTVDLVRPVPMAPLTVRTETVKPGRKVQVVEVRLLAGEEVVTRGTAVRIPATADLELQPDRPPPGPEGLEARPPPGMGRDLEFFHADAVEIRPVPGESRDRSFWVRLVTDLFPGQPASPVVAAAAAADLPSGYSGIQPEGWRSINADITLHLARRPQGEWLNLTARSHAWHGVGFADTALYDTSGRVGRSVQSVLVERWTRPSR